MIDITHDSVELIIRLIVIQVNNRYHLIDNLIFNSSVDDDHSPEKFAVYQNYPNPFNPTTIISFNIDTQTKVSLKV